MFILIHIFEYVLHLQVHEEVFRHGRHFHICDSVPQSLNIGNISLDLVHPDVAGLMKKQHIYYNFVWEKETRSK